MQQLWVGQNNAVKVSQETLQEIFGSEAAGPGRLLSL